MKNVLTLGVYALALSFSVASQAAVTIEKTSVNNAEIQLKLTGEEARLLSQITYEGSALETRAHRGQDFSTIRSITCSDGECIVAVEGDINGKEDIQEYYSKDFNKKLAALKDGEALVTAPGFGKGYMGEEQEYDGKVVRALLEDHKSGERPAKLKKYNLSGIGKRDVGSVPLFKIEKDLGALKITCYSSLEVEIGNKNKVNESCSIAAVAKK